MSDRDATGLAAELDFDLLASWIHGGHERLRRTVLELSDKEYANPSLLPDWTIGHVLTHLSRNSDAVRNLMLSARSGKPVSIYPTRELRAEDIRTGAARTSAAVRSDVLSSMERFEIEMAAMPRRCWEKLVSYQSRFGVEGSFPVIQFLLMRLFEVEVHHVDLQTRYTFTSTPVEIRAMFLDLVAVTLGSRCTPFTVVSSDTNQRIAIGNADALPEITGESDSLLGWLSGRGGGATLRTSNASKLPWLPPLA